MENKNEYLDLMPEQEQEDFNMELGEVQDFNLENVDLGLEGISTMDLEIDLVNF